MSTMDIKINIDWGLLSEQKKHLLELQDKQPELQLTADGESLSVVTGIINLIDGLQDGAIAAGAAESEVYPVEKRVLKKVDEEFKRRLTVVLSGNLLTEELPADWDAGEAATRKFVSEHTWDGLDIDVDTNFEYFMFVLESATLGMVRFLVGEGVMEPQDD